MINQHRLCRAAATLAALFLLMPPAAMQGTIYFRATFESLGSGLYNFAGSFPQSQWTHTHLPTGGWNGTAGAQIRMRAGQTQYQFGFFTPALNHTFTLGEAVYFRYRLKLLDVMRGNEDWGNKFLLMGQSGTSPNNSRILVYMSPQHGTRGCTLDWNNRPETLPDYFGLTASPNRFFTGSVNGVPLMPHSFGFGVKVNIGWTCAGPVFYTYPSSPFRTVRPGAAGRGVAPADGWYHVQIYAKSGNAGQVVFRMWVNHNGESTPTAIGPLVDQEGLGVTAWSQGAHIGGFMDNATPSTDLGYVLDDFEIGSAFDPAWYPGALPPPPVPGPPTNVVITRG